MKEASLLRILQSFVVSRVTYATQYLRLQRAEAIKIDALHRRAYKRAIGLPSEWKSERDNAVVIRSAADLGRLTMTKTGSVLEISYRFISSCFLQMCR